MPRCNNKFECRLSGAVLPLAGVVIALLAGCSVFSGHGNGHGPTRAGKESEMGESSTAGAGRMDSAQTQLASGQADYSDVKELEISVANGTLACQSDDMAAGEVAFEWTYHNGSGGPPPAHNYELRHKLQGRRLVIEDWRDPLKGWLGNNNATLDLTVRHGPGVVISEANLGNGDLVADGAISGALNVGNGTLKLTGELSSDAELNVGNGDVEAEVLVWAGEHSVNVGNGTIALKLRPQSSLAFNATVALGEIEAPPEFAVTTSHLVGASASGSLGDGAAALSLNIGNGSLELNSVDDAA